MAATVLGAGLLPFTGIFLPLIGGLYLVPIIVEVMLVHLVVAAVARKIEWYWLGLPIAGVVAWVSYVTLDYAYARRMQQELTTTGLEANAIGNDRTLVVEPAPSTQASEDTLADWVEASPSIVVFAQGMRFYSCASTLSNKPSTTTNKVGPVCYDTLAKSSSTEIRITERDPIRVGLHNSEIQTFEIQRMRRDDFDQQLGVIHIGELAYADPNPFFPAGCYWDLEGSGLHCGLYPRLRYLFVNERCAVRGSDVDPRRVERLLGLPVPSNEYWCSGIAYEGRQSTRT